MSFDPDGAGGAAGSTWVSMSRLTRVAGRCRWEVLLRPSLSQSSYLPNGRSGRRCGDGGPGYDDAHYISVPIKPLYEVEGVGDLGVCFMEPGDETCLFALEEEDDGTALHQYGPCNEWYYILEGEFTVWWGKDAAKLENSYVLRKADCAYYPTGWKHKVRNTGSVLGKFFYLMTSPPGIRRRLDNER